MSKSLKDLCDDAQAAQQLCYRQQQQGMALLTVLLLVVAIMVVAGSMIASQRVSIRQYELLLTQDQILQDIRAGSQLAVALIAADAKVNDSDSLQDVWAQSIAPTPYKPTSYGEMSMSLAIEDASARFNLNNLYHDGANDEAAIASLQRLLSQVGLEPNLVYAILDWQDPDSETSAEGGAEADAYLNSNLSASASAPISSAKIGNQPFVSVDELMSVRGFTPESVRKLQPFITAVPYFLPINVNTASPTVLSALIEGGAPAQTTAFVNQVKTSPVADVAQMLQQAPWSTLDEKQQEKIKPLVSVESEAFMVFIDIGIRQNEQEKHRYATTFVSKINEEETNQNAQAGPSGLPTLADTAPASDSSTKKIASFGLRLWSYRPVI